MRNAWTVLATVAALLLSLAPGTDAASGSEPTEPGAPRPGELFALLGSPEQTPAGLVTTIDIDEGMLQPQRSITTRLSFSDSEGATAQLRPAPQVAGYLHWSGSVLGEAASMVTVVQRGQQVWGIVSSPRGSYTIATTDAGLQTLTRVSQAQSDADLVITPPEGSPARAPAASQSDGTVAPGPEVDVLVAYTPDAASQAGGTEAIESLAALSVAVSNDAFVASEAELSFAMVGTTESNGDPDDASSDTLAALQAIGDGSYDDVHAVRDELGADLVSLLVEDGGPYCGIAYYPDGADYGFSVVALGCAVANLSFPHELGHHLGAAHDRYVTQTPYYPDGFGFVNLAEEWRTIMAYNDQCSEVGLNCTRIARFSNPDVLYEGDPTGMPAGQPDSADNETALEAGAALVTAYRPSTTVEYALSVARTGTGEGSVRSAPSGINCGRTCTSAFEPGTSVTLTARPVGGSTFVGWSGDCTGSLGSCAVTMSDDRDAVAQFVVTPGETFEESASTLDGWVAYSGPDDGYRASAVAGDTAGFSFSGSEVKWLTKKGPGRGEAAVTIDGVNMGVYDLYAPASRSYTVRFSDLEPVLHDIVIDVLGTRNPVATGDEVVMDAFRSGGDTFHENAVQLVYGAAWERFRKSAASGGTYRSSDDAGHTASLVFTGTAVDWVTAVGPAAGKARVYIDGERRGIVDLYKRRSRYQQLRTYDGLAAGSHEIEVKVLGRHRPASSGAEVVVDAFVVR